MKVTLKCGAELEWDAKRSITKVFVPNAYGVTATEFHDESAVHFDGSKGPGVKRATVCITRREDFIAAAKFLLDAMELREKVEE